MNNVIIFDDEILGSKKPVFFVGIHFKDTGKSEVLWFKKRADMKRLRELLADPKYTWVGFNSETFDRPLIAAALDGRFNEFGIKELAQVIIEERLQSFETYRQFGIDFVDYKHIDLFHVAPGVMISLKTYAGRLGYKTMVDLPYHHDHDLSPAEQKIAANYCKNDLGVTATLFNALSTEIELRREMSEEYGIDLMSKSDAQIAEAILKKRVGIGRGDKIVPRSVGYKTPANLIKTTSPVILEIIDLLEKHQFKLNHGNGSPEVPSFLEEPVGLGYGTYQMGVGGLHSTHDVSMYLEASDDVLLSDFDVASYYPNIMLMAGATPKLGGDKGRKFIEEYKRLYDQRIAAKRSGNKRVANSLKIVLNGTFGKLGNLYCSFFAPELMLAVTITGQLNLMCLIYELEKIKGVKVRSANTDGILVEHSPKNRDKVLKVFAANSKRTKFEYEETKYLKYAAKDVNNYMALKDDGTIKAKGLYASNNPDLNPLYLMKNPTMEVCSNMLADWLIDGALPEVSIKKYKDMTDFVAIRNVQGGGIQYDKYVPVDDWVEIEEGVWRRPHWPAMKASVRRKSRPPAVDSGIGGKPFGRVARWYMTKDKLPPLTYLSSGNKVPKTDGAKICMTLPDKLPKDLDFDWYVKETYSIMKDCGIFIL